MSKMGQVAGNSYLSIEAHIWSFSLIQLDRLISQHKYDALLLKWCSYLPTPILVPPYMPIRSVLPLFCSWRQTLHLTEWNVFQEERTPVCDVLCTQLELSLRFFTLIIVEILSYIIEITSITLNSDEFSRSSDQCRRWIIGSAISV